MNKKVGLPPELVRKTNNILSAGTVGEFYPGHQIDAIANGVMAGFSGSILIPDAIGATVGATKTTAASLATLAAASTYLLLGEKGVWRVHYGAVTVAGVADTQGLYTTISGSPKSRGIYKFQLADVNDKASSILDNYGNVFPVGTSQDFEVEFGIAAYANLTTYANTIQFAEFGIVEGATTLDPASAPGTYYHMFKMGGGKILMRSETTASIKNIDYPSGYLQFTLRYVASQRTVYYFVNGELMGSTAVHASMVGAQCFVRVAHGATYAAATHSPTSVDLDYVIGNAPLMDHQA